MKKTLTLALAMMLLTACATEQATTESPVTTETVTTTETETTEAAQTEAVTEAETEAETEAPKDDAVGEVEESEMGKRTIVHSKKGLSEVYTSGPFEVKVTDIQVSNFEPSDSAKPMFNDQERVTIVTIAIEVENKSTDTNSIYPDQGTVVTNTKEQVETDLFLSDSVGGDYMGEVRKTGNIIVQLQSPAEEITNIKYIISGPSSAETFDRIGDDIEIEFNFAE